MLTADRLRELLDYDQTTGVFTRRVAVGNRKAGEVAGCLDTSEGYWRITIDGRQYGAHRLAWLHVTGEWAPHDVDHKDRVRSNNRFDNLRPATRAENLQNQVAANARSKSGVRGVAWDAARQKWKVGISVENRNKFLGRFVNKDDADAAYRAGQRQYHPGSLA